MRGATPTPAIPTEYIASNPPPMDGPSVNNKERDVGGGSRRSKFVQRAFALAPCRQQAFRREVLLRATAGSHHGSLRRSWAPVVVHCSRRSRASLCQLVDNRPLAVECCARQRALIMEVVVLEGLGPRCCALQPSFNGQVAAIAQPSCAVLSGIQNLASFSRHFFV